MNVWITLVPNQQPTKAVQPSQFALGDPAVATEMFARLNSLARDSRYNPASPKSTTVGGRAIPKIGVQFGGAPTRATGSATYRSNAIDHRLECGHIGHVRGGEHRGCERNAPSVDDHMMLRAQFPAIRGVGASCCAPLFAGACAESTEARDQSIAPACCSRSSRRWCTRCQTPASCQSRKRFQQVMPLQPSSCGRSSQGMPVRRTNTMPANATRSGVLGRPLRERRGSLGSSGSISAHSSSSMSRRATPSPGEKCAPAQRTRQQSRIGGVPIHAS
jgi:hypothetical protein